MHSSKLREERHAQHGLCVLIQLLSLQVAQQFYLQAQSVMCSVARHSLCQDTMVMAAAAHARLLATLRCMNAPKMAPILVVPASVGEASPRL